MKILNLDVNLGEQGDQRIFKKKKKLDQGLFSVRVSKSRMFFSSVTSEMLLGQTDVWQRGAENDHRIKASQSISQASQFCKLSNSLGGLYNFQKC